MNLFILDDDPQRAATLHCDKHVVKMLLETAQILSSAFEPGTAPYRRTHYNHPCTAWSRQSRENYMWAVNLGISLNMEYKYRYDSEIDHKSFRVIMWCLENIEALQLPSLGLTPFAKAMPEDCRLDDTVESYRTYYRKHKREIAKWKKREAPQWYF